MVEEALGDLDLPLLPSGDLDLCFLKDGDFDRSFVLDLAPMGCSLGDLDLCPGVLDLTLFKACGDREPRLLRTLGDLDLFLLRGDLLPPPCLHMLGDLDLCDEPLPACLFLSSKSIFLLLS